MSILVLPPYEHSLQPLRSTPDLGSVLCAVLQGDPVGDLRRAVTLWGEWAWCPLVFASFAPDQGTSTSDGFLLNELGVACLRLAAADGPLPSGLSIRAALCGRPAFCAESFCSFLGLRAGRGLAARVWDALQSVQASTRNKRFIAVHTGLTLRDWRNFYCCLQAVDTALRLGLTQEAAAMTVELDVKTLARWLGRFFDRGWRDVIGLGAWEPLAEYTLRRGGAVATSQLASATAPTPRMRSGSSA